MMDNRVEKHQYLNPVQMRSYLAYANHEVLIAGRGMGKSEGIIAPRLIRWAKEMPRATIINEAATYQQHFNRTLPGIFQGLEKFGWKRDRDFFVGHYAPDRFKIDKPYFRPIRPEYMIHFKTGACMVLVSHDRPGSANGLSAAAVVGDEAKYLNYQKHKEEVMPAIRGNAHIFGHASCFGGLLLTSDMPVSNEGQWLLDYGDENANPDLINAIIELQLDQNKFILELNKPNITEQRKSWLNREIKDLQKALDHMRLGNPEKDIPPSFFFHEAPSTENIEILRPEYFKRMQKDLSVHEYNTAILNKRFKQIPNGFYPLLSESRHGYTMFNNGYLDSLGHDVAKHQDIDCRQDLDVDPNSPLDISLDYGGNFNCMVVGQWHGNEYRLLHGFHVGSPKKLSDLLTLFKRYYRYHREKHIRYYFDHTAKQSNSVTDFRPYEEVMHILRQHDEYGSWSVADMYIGITPSYQSRYELWNKVLHPSNADRTFKYHLIHCEDWSTSCMLAPVKRTNKSFEKDKTSERDPKLKTKQERATHYSDACDTLLFAVMHNYFLINS